jgi:hypothetical protein
MALLFLAWMHFPQHTPPICNQFSAYAADRGQHIAMKMTDSIDCNQDLSPFIAHIVTRVVHELSRRVKTIKIKINLRKPLW